MLVMKPENENEETRGTEGARRATGVAREAAGRNGDNPDPEVTNKAIRRRFSAAYKRRVVREADRCTKPGELGALLRREGLYSSSLRTWRRQHDAGELAGMGSAKRGRKAQPTDGRDKRIAELEGEAQRLQRKLEQAETVIEIQKQSPLYWGFLRRTRTRKRTTDGSGRKVLHRIGDGAGVPGLRGFPRVALSASAAGRRARSRAGTPTIRSGIERSRSTGSPRPAA